ncbi:glycosyltransferase family 2 protein [Bacteroides sp. 519]|uniref:glycosyltransferase family 2 protein n=1 Tax=Bacteroides sp. 519 TaxID=2302937 RepID=UPI0013D16005|nr:glycosyltransferase family 2 protein [Bacteroides sp. 519]NDV58989.1 glycosyltransferase family 2 protein [Bacteroides sp. 519]
MISIICPTLNEEKYIRTCIESILQQDFPQSEMEVIFVDGNSEDNTRQIISEYISKYPFIKIENNPDKIVPIAMNIGIKVSHGDVIIRIDAHSVYPSNYFSVLVKKLVELDADNVGVPCKTDVLNKTPKSIAIKEVLSNRFGVGNSTFRLGVNDIQKVDTVPFGCWRRNVFDKYGYYDTRLIRNQDIELNKRILRGKGKIYLVPDTYCTYYAREDFSGISRNNYNNGKWNVLTVFYTRTLKSLSLRHFIPLLFILSIFIPFILSLFYSPFIYLSLLSVLIYIVLITLISLNIRITKNTNFFYLFTAFTVLHISYGCGSFVGLINIVFNAYKTKK